MSNATASRTVQIYDTTLRDGTQGEGFNLSLSDKLAVAAKLDDLGVDYIEGGFPISNPKDEAFFRDVKKLNLKRARIAAFGMTRRRGVTAEEDTGLTALLAAETPVVTIVGKSSLFHAEQVLGVSGEENLAMIAQSVGHIARHDREVVYDAEHFFDAFADNPDYALSTLRAARDAGAAVLVLCDTNGGSMPERIAEATRRVVEELQTPVGIHTHNDCGVAIANGLAGVHAGAVHAQGTVNGVGERCGNMDLLPFMANLRFKYGIRCLAEGSFARLTEASRYVYELANLIPASGQPYVGPSAFAHKGGMHVHAVRKTSKAYEHVEPAAVGNTRKVLVSELSGASNIAEKVGDRFDLTNDKTRLRAVLNRVQELEHQGYHFEAAEASFELLVRGEVGQRKQFWELVHYRVVVNKFDVGPATSEATIKIKVQDATEHRVADGDGPVNALDAALRKCLKDHYPAIGGLHLQDYKVRVINSAAETAAAVRVIIECRRHKRDGQSEYFGTIGVHENIIDASWQALAEAYEYHLTSVDEGR